MAILTVSGLGIALAANLYIFQPNPWDNMKFLTYALYFLSLPVAYMLSRWWKRAWPAVLLLLASLTLSGGLAIGRDLHLNYPVVTGTDLIIAAKVRQLLPEDALVVTTDRHNNPIPVLTGRRVLMGYPGWLWSYGIDYQPLALEVKQIFSGGSQADRLIAKHGITHLILAEKDAASVGFNLSYYQTHYQLQYQGDGWWIFNLRPALSQPLAPF